MPPAARETDLQACEMVTGVVPHVGGPILPPCFPGVLIGGLAAARVTDTAFCVGGPATITVGCPTVLIGGQPAAFLGSVTDHGGSVTGPCFPGVMIG